jgi:hypothetical protein
MLVFRVEKLHNPSDAIGAGAFGSCLAMDHDDMAHQNNDGTCVYDMPCPGQEPEGNPVHTWITNTGGYNHMRFGFESIRSYREAFNSPSGREHMHERGGVLSVYEVDRKRVLVGYAQVLFDYRKAKRVAVLKTTDDYYAA